MHFDQQAVGAGGHGGAGQGRHHPGLAARMGGIDDDRQMGLPFQPRDGGHVEHIPVGRFKSADAALAEDDVMVTAGGNVFRRHQPFGDGCRHAALQDHRRFYLADFLQQVEVLHVAGANLYHVHAVLQKRFQHARVHQLRDDGQVVLVGGGAKHFQSFNTGALKGVRAGARLESAAAHQVAAGLIHSLGGQIHLRLGFHRAGPAYYLHLLAAYLDPLDIDDGVIRMPLAGDNLVWLENMQGLLDTGKRIEHLRVELALVANRSKDGSFRAARRVHLQARVTDLSGDGFDLSIARVTPHHNNHGWLLTPFISAPLPAH